jgi:hypothetical protein
MYSRLPMMRKVVRIVTGNILVSVITLKNLREVCTV